MLNFNSTKIIKEEWRPIKEFVHLYEVSNKGRFRNKRGVLLKPWNNNSNYVCIKFTVRGKGIHKLIHRLIAEVFLIPTLIHKAEVNHKDGNKLNNNLLNLEWVSSSYNKHHAFALGLRTKESCVSTLGTKHKSTVSKYFNVGYDVSRKKWTATIRHNGKNYMQKRFNTEDEAALHVNFIIDTLGLKDRPYNIVS